jgi:hypothetical protein
MMAHALLLLPLDGGPLVTGLPVAPRPETGDLVEATTAVVAAVVVMGS